MQHHCTMTVDACSKKCLVHVSHVAVLFTYAAAVFDYFVTENIIHFDLCHYLQPPDVYVLCNGNCFVSYDQLMKFIIS